MIVLERQLPVLPAVMGADHRTGQADQPPTDRAGRSASAHHTFEAANQMRPAQLPQRPGIIVVATNVARDLNNLAGLLQATNRLAEAEPLMRPGLAIFVQSLGTEHPNTNIVGNNFIVLLQIMGRMEDEIGDDLASLFGKI